jgi:ribosome-binding factor A
MAFYVQLNGKMAMTQRTDRLAEIIKEEISQIIQSELKDPRLGFITITGAKVSPDIRHAVILFSVLGGEERTKSTVEGLQSSKGFIRNELGTRIRLKYLPELDFKLDKSIEEGIRISELITRIHEKEEKE